MRASVIHNGAHKRLAHHRENRSARGPGRRHAGTAAAAAAAAAAAIAAMAAIAVARAATQRRKSAIKRR